MHSVVGLRVHLRLIPQRLRRDIVVGITPDEFSSLRGDTTVSAAGFGFTLSTTAPLQSASSIDPRLHSVVNRPRLLTP